MDLDGLVVIAVAGLWIAYLVPQHLRHRQQLLEARADDRFSERLRVLRVAQTVRVRTTGERSPAAPPERVLLHPPRRGGDRPMRRPHAAADRADADATRRIAAARAARGVALSRRSAAARRRAVLTAALLLVVVGGWSAVALTSAGLVLGAIPSALLVTVLAFGRGAVLAGRRSDAAWSAGDTDGSRPETRTRTPSRHVPARRGARRPVPSTVGRAVRPSDAVTEVIVRERASVGSTLAGTAPSFRVDVSGEARAEAPGATSDVMPGDSPMVGGGVGTWVPVPVPPPAYTLKAMARRAEPAPLPDLEVAATQARADADATATRAEEPRPTTGGLPLDAILARRRVVGE